MWGQVLMISLFLISALAISLRKFYLESPIIEPASLSPALKRRTVKSTKREHTLSGFLIFIAIICFSLFAGMLADYVSSLVYLAVLALGLFWIFIYLPGKNSGRLITDMGNLLAPIFIGLLNKTRAQTKGLERRFREQAKLNMIARYLTKTEILEILNQQKINYDGRSLARGLNLAINSIDLGSKRIEDFMIPLSDVHLIGAQETVGPILIDELHKSGRQIFPVNAKEQGIVGTVSLTDLVVLSEGSRTISDVVSYDLQYLDEEDNVTIAFQKFIKSTTTMFIVRSENKNTGVLYFEDVVAQILNED